jgi:hypothetical protein
VADVLVQFDAVVVGEDGRTWLPRACGRPTEHGMWEAWIEFDPQDGGVVLETPSETTQPNRPDLDYWAQGLTATYLEGALQRALSPELPDLRLRQVAARPAYDAPATVRSGAPHSTIVPHAVLDPFQVYAQGEHVLLGELTALEEGHLRSIVREHGLIDDDDVDLLAMDRHALAELIVAAVRRRAG